MSTISHPGRPAASTLLVEGQRLDQATFHERYEAMPANVKAELIQGVVYMASPMREPHGHYTSKLNLVFSLYELSTLGTRVTEGISAILGERSEQSVP